MCLDPNILHRNLLLYTHNLCVSFRINLSLALTRKIVLLLTFQGFFFTRREDTLI